MLVINNKHYFAKLYFPFLPHLNIWQAFFPEKKLSVAQGWGEWRIQLGKPNFSFVASKPRVQSWVHLLRVSLDEPTKTLVKGHVVRKGSYALLNLHYLYIKETDMVSIVLLLILSW